ncbi:MAG TPA: hypothetical protein DCW29_04170 [Janthinobacterium sp.]|nr:hypothetical protein [Janthinobacterium sp.]
MQTNTPAGDDARSDAVTAALVERGIQFHKTLGKTVATAFFRENHVPDGLVERILSTSRARRGTPSRLY